jgi:hypothetical protein
MVLHDHVTARVMKEEEFREGLAAAGFTEIEIRETHRVHEFASSAIIHARKPAKSDPDAFVANTKVTAPMAAFGEKCSPCCFSTARSRSTAATPPSKGWRFSLRELSAGAALSGR